MIIVEDILRLVPLLTTATLTATWGPLSITLETSGTDGGLFRITDSSNGEQRDVFDDDDLADARAAFRGDVVAALRLTSEWTVVAHIDPSLALTRADSTRHWLVLPDVETFTALLERQPWWELRSLLEPGQFLMITIHRTTQPLEVSCLHLRVLDLNGSKLAARPTDFGPPPILGQRLPGVADPAALYPMTAQGAPDDLDRVLGVLRRVTSASCWALLATEVVTEPKQAKLEYFGLQRQSWAMPASGPHLTPMQHEAVHTLWEACANSTNPDRLLATRQIISLYPHDPWAFAADITRAADPLLLALRSEATAEALRAQREARNLALTIARQTAESTVSLAKGAVERSLVVIGGLAGIIVAHTTKSLTSAQAADLRHLLAAFMLILIPWSFLIEGRAVTSALSTLKSDMGTFSDLLSADQVAAVLGITALERARTQAWIARAAVPTAYLAAAAVVFWLPV